MSAPELATTGDERVVVAGNVEREVVYDMLRRAAPALPVVIGVAGLVWGVDGAISAGFAIVLVVLNFLLAAFLLSWAARISLALLMVAALGGFVVRLGLLTLAVLLVQHQSWFEPWPLALTLGSTHLGLLVWETRHVSASLAFPGVKPRS
jgi:hypothetical protein